MLTPEQIGDAGELVAGVYRQIEAELVDYLVARMVEGDLSGQRVHTAINLLAQSMPDDLRRIIDAHAGEIEEAVAAEVKSLLASSDSFDLARLAADVGVGAMAGALTAQTLAVTKAVMGAMRADSLAMSDAARAKFQQWSTWAVTQVATGNMSSGQALRKAVRELAGDGLAIPFVTYKGDDGRVTVRCHCDVAVQRQIRTLIAQGAAELTMRRMDDLGAEYVEVSSHIGSRPSHAEWQGRVYHRGGAAEVDGERYEDFEYGTGYGGKCGPYAALGDRLLGVNCRHSFAPWVPGSPRAYSPDPKHPSGLSNDEVYALTQRQRALERHIRATKREVAAQQRVYEADPTPENMAELTRLRAKLTRQQGDISDFIKESNARCKTGTAVLRRQPDREWTGDMPNGPLKPVRDSIVASSGLSEQMWLRQFDNEVLTAKLPDGSTFSKTGTPMGVTLTPQEAKQLHGAELTHTHTTTIGGTFSWEDIDLTVATASPRHTVNATLGKRWYRLSRTAETTSDRAAHFVRDFHTNEALVRNAEEDRIWREEYETAGVPLDDAGRRKALAVVKSEMHGWLKDHAVEYGFEYTFGKLGQ